MWLLNSVFQRKQKLNYCSLVVCGWEFTQHTHSQQDWKKNKLMKDAFYIKRAYSDIKSAYIKILWPTQQEVYWLREKNSAFLGVKEKGKKTCMTSLNIRASYQQVSSTVSYTTLHISHAQDFLWPLELQHCWHMGQGWTPALLGASGSQHSQGPWHSTL